MDVSNWLIHELDDLQELIEDKIDVNSFYSMFP